MKTKLPLSREYAEFVREMKARIQSARISAARALNRDLILLYWDIGRGILEKQAHLGWGKAVVETLAKDLTNEFPSTNSFSPDNLWRMQQLYAAYRILDFWDSLSQKRCTSGEVPTFWYSLLQNQESWRKELHNWSLPFRGDIICLFSRE